MEDFVISVNLRPTTPAGVSTTGGYRGGVDGEHEEVNSNGHANLGSTAPLGGPATGGLGEGDLAKVDNVQTDNNTRTTGGVNTSRGTQTPTPFLSFSPKTCIELLPSLTAQQLEYETSYFKTILGPVSVIDCKQGTRKSPAAITKCLTGELMRDTDKMTDHFTKIDTLNNNFFMLVNKAEKLLSELNSEPSKEQDSTPLLSDLILDSAPVSVLNISINTNVDDCTEGVYFNKIGNREVDYFGLYPYRYGQVQHKPKPYPKTPFFDNVCRVLNKHDPEFNLNLYTCLVTRYKDGESGIAPHSDDEECIVPSSTIYTVSVGAERTLVCRNKLGKIIEHRIPLTDGSIYEMTRDSQDIWEHCIPSVKSCELPRISFTFRKIKPSLTPAPPPPIPPIKEFVSACNKENPKRILLITDSIISGFPVNIFDNTGISCIKKLPVDKLLVNIDSFEQEFAYTDCVVISAGMNDLSRFGHTGESLGSFISGKIRYWLCKYPNTLFVFNSLIHTNRPWLDNRVDCLNKLMFELSVELYDSNFWFFDSHASFVDVGDRFPVHSPTGNGIHISIRACQYISRIMADAIGALVSNSPVTSRVWPLRSGFRRSISGSQHPRYRGQGIVSDRHRPGLRY